MGLLNRLRGEEPGIVKRVIVGIREGIGCYLEDKRSYKDQALGRDRQPGQVAESCVAR